MAYVASLAWHVQPVATSLGRDIMSTQHDPQTTVPPGPWAADRFPGRQVRALMAAVRRFNRKGGWVMSSHVAMSMLLALFPFILFVVALAGALTSDVDVDDLIELVFGSWPDEIAAPITTEVRNVLLSRPEGLLTLGAALTVVFASNGVDAVRKAMTRAYRGDDPRPFWKQRLLCLVFVLVGAVVVVAAALFGVFAPLYFRFISDTAPALYGMMFANATLRTVFTMTLLVLAVTACHVWLPGYKRPAAQIWPGVILTVVCWFFATEGFAIYVSRFASYSATYAGLAGAMSALMFLYLMSAILILGAELNGALGEVKEGHAPE